MRGTHRDSRGDLCAVLPGRAGRLEVHRLEGVMLGCPVEHDVEWCEKHLIPLTESDKLPEAKKRRKRHG